MARKTKSTRNALVPAATSSDNRRRAMRRESDVALLRSEEFFRELIENSLDAIAVVNAEGILTYQSPSFERLLGYSLEGHISTSGFKFVHPEDKLKTTELFAQLVHNPGGVVHHELRAQHKDGSWRSVELLGQNRLDDPAVGGIVVNVHDITERKQAEEAVRRSEEYFRVLMENALDVIVVLNSDTSIRFKSPSFERMFGEARKGKSPFESIHPDDMPKAAEAYTHLMQSPGTTVHMEIRGQHRDGSWRTFEVLGRNLLDDPAVGGIVANFRDITERRRMEQQLLLSGRLAAVGELAAGVAHELNNPLAAVQAYAQFLSSRKDLDETMKSDVETIYKEAQRASKITSNLLSFARSYKPQKSFISINETIEKCLELHEYRLKGNNIEVVSELDADLPMTLADDHQVQQVFGNLITNAEQAMTEAHGKGKLTIKTQKVGEMIQATFVDDGPGIPAGNLKRIFDPFFTTKEVGEGTGLGLSMCYGIVQGHGGNLYARSKPGKGTTFVVEIPIVLEDQAATEQTNPVQG